MSVRHEGGGQGSSGRQHPLHEAQDQAEGRLPFPALPAPARPPREDGGHPRPPLQKPLQPDQKSPLPQSSGSISPSHSVAYAWHSAQRAQPGQAVRGRPTRHRGTSQGGPTEKVPLVHQPEVRGTPPRSQAVRSRRKRALLKSQNSLTTAVVLLNNGKTD